MLLTETVDKGTDSEFSIRSPEVVFDGRNRISATSSAIFYGNLFPSQLSTKKIAFPHKLFCN